MSTPSKLTPPSPRYQTLFCEFMAFVHEKPKPYPNDHEFSEDDITSVKPDDIVKWLSIKAFGKADPEPDARITGAGSASIEFMKKSLSFYMPKKPWSSEDRTGNPTKSAEVKGLCRRIINLEEERKARRKSVDTKLAVATQVKITSGGTRGLLQRVQNQNADFIDILASMGEALETFTRSVHQMKAAMETNNIAIHHQLSSNKGNDDEETMPYAEEVPTILNTGKDIRKAAGRVAESLKDFVDTHDITSSSARIESAEDGFCTFGKEADGKVLDLPEGFILPTCNLLQAWRHWITGFPDFKMRNNKNEIVDAPIRPLRRVTIGTIPRSLKKKFKDGWRPILISMDEDTKELLDSTPVTSIDESFIQKTYSAALNDLYKKAPGIFAEVDSGKYNSWKVATWSRKIREQNLGVHQRRRAKEDDDGFPELAVPTVETAPPPDDGNVQRESI